MIQRFKCKNKTTKTDLKIWSIIFAVLEWRDLFSCSQTTKVIKDETDRFSCIIMCHFFLAKFKKSNKKNIRANRKFWQPMSQRAGFLSAPTTRQGKGRMKT